MPGIEDDLKAALLADATVAALIGERCYAGTIPPHTSPTPWVYFTVPAEGPDEDLYTHDAQKWDIEFELYATTYAEVRTLKRAVRAVLNRYRGGQVRRCMWVDGDYVPVEGGHNWTDRYTVWGSDPTIVPTAGANARIVTGAGVIYLYPTGADTPVVIIDSDGHIIGDGSELTGLPSPDLTPYARKDQANTFTAGPQVFADGGVRIADAGSSRKGTVTYVDAAGATRFGRTDEATYLEFIPRSTSADLSAVGGAFNFRTSQSFVVICGRDDGANSIVDLNRRLSDDSAGVGGQVRCWTRNGQSQDAFVILAPGGGSSLMSIDATGAIKPASMADVSAPNGSVYYSTTAGKLVYKDAGGAVNNLY